MACQRIMSGHVQRRFCKGAFRTMYAKGSTDSATKANNLISAVDRTLKIGRLSVSERKADLSHLLLNSCS